MKFEGSGSKGTRVIERKRSVTDGQTNRQPDGRTDRRTDGQGKNNMSPPEGGVIIQDRYRKATVILPGTLPILDLLTKTMHNLSPITRRTRLYHVVLAMLCID